MASTPHALHRSVDAAHGLRHPSGGSPTTSLAPGLKAPCRVSTEPHVDLEHRELDRALGVVEYLAQRRSFGPATNAFLEFRRMLEAHLDHEEAVTFPEYERRTGDPGHVLELIRAQHRGLEAQLRRLAGALTSADYQAFCSHLDVFDRLLRAHQATEERLLPPQHAHEAHDSPGLH
jgi:hypothetical protein